MLSQLIPAPLRPHPRHILHVHPQHALQLVQRAQDFILGVCPAVPGDPEKLDILQLPDTTEARDERMDDQSVGVAVQRRRRREGDRDEDLVGAFLRERDGHRDS